MTVQQIFCDITVEVTVGACGTAEPAAFLSVLHNCAEANLLLCY